MHTLPFAQPGRFYRGNLHTHSTRSDGRKSPEQVCQFYREMGYHFLSITDHFMERYGYPLTDVRACDTPDFITLPGAELHAGQIEIGDIWHILAVGLPFDFAPNLPDETGPQIAQRAMEAGAFVAAAHPAWYSLGEADVLSLGKVHAIEVINGISEDHNDRIDSWYMVDRMCALGHRYTACATDDAHFHERHADLLRGWVWVKSEALTASAILESLKAGHYYSSEGPMIHDIRVTRGDRIRVRCSPADHVFVTGKGSRAVSLHGNGMIEAELDIRRLDSPFCRVTVRDRDGYRAWSNPIWFD